MLCNSLLHKILWLKKKKIIVIPENETLLDSNPNKVASTIPDTVYTQ